MDSLLYQIYSGEYEFTPDREEKQPALYAQLDKVEEILGGGFVDRLLELEGEAEDRRAFQSYRAGFCLGVRLMLEALTSATG